MPMPRDLPCAGCGNLMWRSRTSLPEGRATCLACRRAGRRPARALKHGERTTYDKGGCRCDLCRAANARQAREYRATFRARTGRSLTREYRSDDLQTGAWIGKRRRLAIYERDAWCCQLCGYSIDQDADPTVGGLAPSLDHITPRSLGGDDRDENLRTAHRDCNAKRGNRADTTHAPALGQRC